MRKYHESILEYLQLFLQVIAVKQFQLRSCMWLCCCYIVDGRISQQQLQQQPVAFCLEKKSNLYPAVYFFI